MPTAAEIRAELERRKKAAPPPAVPPPAAPTGNRPDPEAIKAELARRMVTMGTPQAAAPASSSSGLGPVNPMVAEGQAMARQYASADPGMSPLRPDVRGDVALRQSGRQLPALRGPVMSSAQRAAMAPERAEGLRQRQLAAERRDASRAYGGGMDMAVSTDDRGRLQPGTEADRDLSKSMMAALPNAASDLAESVANLPGDAIKQITGNRLIPQVDLPRMDMEYESPVGAFAGPAVENLTQFILARRLVGKAAKGGGSIASRAKDAVAVFAGVDSDEQDWGRLAEMVDGAIQETGSPQAVKDAISWIAERDPENPLLERVKNIIDFAAPDEALRFAGKGLLAADHALMGRSAPVPANAGGAWRRPVAPQPSVAPVAQPAVSNAPQRPAQPGPTGAGQQPAGGPATLQASPVSGNPAVARDTQDIFRKLFIDSNVPRNNVDRLLGELTNDFQVFQRSGSPIATRIGLAEFVDANVRETANRLGMNMTPDVERQIQTAIRGRGRAAHGSEGGSKQDRQPSVMSQYIEDMRTTQKDWAREQIEAPNAFNKADISVQRDAMKATAKDIGQQVYGQGLKLAREVWNDVAPAAAGEKEALTNLQNYLLRKPYLQNVPDYVKLRLAVDDVPLEDAIKADPAGMAHRIQSVLGEAASQANDPAMRSALGEARERLLKELQDAVPAYRQARKDFGDEFATMRAFDFGRPFFADSRRPVDVADMKADYQQMTTRQKTAARMAVRDEIFGVFGMNAEDAAVRLEVLTRGNTLDALEEVFGAPGKRVADTLRRLRQESQWLSGDKSRGLAGVDIFSGSSTVPNGKIIERDAMSVRNGFQRAIAKAGDVSKFMFAVPADLALMVGSGGAYHLPMLSLGAAGGKLTKGLGNASPRKLSNATEGMFSLPKQNVLAPPSRPARVRGPRSPATQQPLPTDVRELLNAYAAAPTKRERQRIRRALEALGEQVPTAPAPTGPRRPPEQSGFGGAPVKGGSGTVQRMIAGGVVGGMAGTFAGQADAQAEEKLTADIGKAESQIATFEQEIADLKKAKSDFDKITDPFKKQRFLKDQGLYAGKIEGDIAGKTTEGINAWEKKNAEAQARAEEDLAAKKAELADLKKQAAYRQIQKEQNPFFDAVRELGPSGAAVLGGIAATVLRVRGVGKSKQAVKVIENDINDLLTKGDVKSLFKKGGAQNDRRNRAVNMNEFYRRGGTPDNKLPFNYGPSGWKSNPKAAKPGSLFKPETTTKMDGVGSQFFRPNDVKLIGAGVLDAALVTPFVEGAKEELKKAQLDVENGNESIEALRRVEKAKTNLAMYEAVQRFGLGLAAAGGLSAGYRYKLPRPDIRGAEDEVTKIADYLKSKAPAKPPRAPRVQPPSATPVAAPLNQLLLPLLPPKKPGNP